MAFTGQLGTAASMPGNIELGRVGTVIAPPGPVPPATVFVRVPIRGVPWSAIETLAPVSSPAPPSAPDVHPASIMPALFSPIPYVPWGRFRVARPLPAIAPPAIPGLLSEPPAYRLTIPGVPWLPHTVPLRLDQPPPSIPPPAAYLAPARGVPIHGVPWVVGGAGSGISPLPPSPPPPPPPPTPPPLNAKAIPLLLRVPDSSTQHGKERLRRFTELLSSIMNSLARKGQLTQGGPDDWSIESSSSGSGLTGTFP